MGQIGVWQIVIVAVVAILLFGRGRISELMGDVAKGINSFKKGLKDEDEEISASIDQKETKVVNNEKKRVEAD